MEIGRGENDDGSASKRDCRAMVRIQSSYHSKDDYERCEGSRA